LSQPLNSSTRNRRSVGAGVAPLYPAGVVLVVDREPTRTKQTSSCTNPPDRQQLSQGDQQSQEAPRQKAQEDSYHCRKVHWASTPPPILCKTRVSESPPFPVKTNPDRHDASSFLMIPLYIKDSE
jgi:hypothetical protein